MTTHIQPHATKQDPREPLLDRDVAARLALTEYERVADLFATLTPAQWAAPTDCPGWDVRAMAGHMLGMVQMASSIPRMVRQQVAAGRGAKRDGGEMIDALTGWQVAHNSGLSTDELSPRPGGSAPAPLVSAVGRPGSCAARQRPTRTSGGRWATCST